MTDPEREARQAEWARKLNPEELAPMLESAKRQGIHLRKCPSADGESAKGCWFGRSPTLPERYDWPWFMAREEPQAPMHFLAQINLASVPEVDGTPSLPKTGTLFFFFDPMIAPVYDTPPGSGRVIYCPDDVSNVPLRKMPALPTHFSEEEVSYFYREFPTEGLERWPFTFEPFETWEFDLFPNAEFWKAAINLHQNQYEKLDRATRRDRGRAIVPGTPAISRCMPCGAMQANAAGQLLTKHICLY